MKTTISGLILGGVMAFSLAACNTTPMNSDGAMGSSGAGMTSSGAPSGTGENAGRGSAPVNCTINGTTDGTSVGNTPGSKCPTESH